MAQIIAYPSADKVSADDCLLGTQKDQGTSNITNPTKNFSVDSVVQAGLGYTAYTALLTQAGGSAPVATVLKNNTGATLSWSYVAGGIYEVTADNPIFTVNKTIVFNNNGIDNGGGNTPPQWTRTSDTVIRLITGGIDNAMENAAFEVRIYL